MNKKLLTALIVVGLTSFIVGCSSSDQANTNANQETTQAAPDNSEITTTTDSSGTQTQTRVFRDNPRVSRVVVTTRNGQRTTTVYSKSGESREINDVGDALSATGDKLADAAGFVVAETKPVVTEVGDKLEDVADKTKSGVREVGDKAEDVGDKAKSTAKTVGSKTQQGTEKVVNETVKGAKKTGKTIKKVITP